MKFLHNLRAIRRKISDWVYLHSSAILVMTGLWFFSARGLVLGGYEVGWARGFAAAGKPVIEYVDRSYEHDYIGNFNSELFHRSGCITLPYEDKRGYLDDRAVAVGLGCRPCQNFDR